MFFASDNWAGAPDSVFAALAAAAEGFAPGYGVDPLSLAVERKLSELFGREVAIFFVATGTAANSLALAAFGRPGGMVFCHHDAHIAADEGGAPEFLGSGLRMRGLPGEGGRLAPATLAAALGRIGEGNVHQGRPAALSLTQSTEIGTVYRPADVAALAALAHAAGIGVHMDGARFANAAARLVAEGTAPSEVAAESTWRAGVDVMSLGFTKLGAIAAEAVVFFDPEQAREFPFLRKRGGHLFSKARFVAAQFDALLEGGRWLELAAHANAMAERLAAGLKAVGAVLPVEPEANELFPLLPVESIVRLRTAGAQFYDWTTENETPPEGFGMVRLVTSFATTHEHVDRFVELCAG